MHVVFQDGNIDRLDGAADACACISVVVDLGIRVEERVFLTAVSVFVNLVQRVPAAEFAWVKGNG